MSAIPQNQAAFTLAEALALTAGKLVGAAPVSAGGGQVSFSGVSTDTRADLSGKLFVALRGERFDAHDFLADARRKGALAALVERDAPPSELLQIRVEKTLTALGELGRAWRRRQPAQVIAIGGSAGKTTTRSAVGAVLEALHPGAVHQTSGNLNNLIGVPLVLLGLGSQHRYAVIELGTNAPGEVSALMRITEPDISVLTLIAIEHTEGLGDLDGVEREEGDLFLGKLAVIGNVDDERVARRLRDAKATERIGYGFSEAATVRALKSESLGLRGQKLTVERPSGEIMFELPLLGDAGAYAALAALSVCEILGLGKDLDAAILERAFRSAGEPGRLVTHELAGGTIVLDDTYNANPASMLSSIKTARELAQSRSARLVLVLGEMRELGAAAVAEHERVGRAAAESGAALVAAIGGEAQRFVEPVAKAGSEAFFSKDPASALPSLLARLAPGDVILVKASRGVRAEQVVKGILAQRGGTAS